VTMKYDAENVYLKLNVADDVLMGTGNVWDMDNIEIYFDLDNSKNVHWPRNGGWMASDPTFDTNDFQFRLVPGKDWSANNSIKDVIQVYTKTETGYNFDVTIPWKSLSTDFVPASGALIGFDILMSDNDDNFRNQITWKSTTDKPFNDPSLWGTLQLTPSGSFIVVDDVEAPKEVSNVVATAKGNKIVVTWDAATDNVAVMSYIIYNKATVIDTVYAAETGNSYTFSNLANGSYRPGVVAVDNFGNVSKKIQSAAAVDIKVSVENMVNTSFNVYPNPSKGLINIKTSGNGKNQLVIYNAAGQKVHSAEFIQKHTVDLKEVNKGIYFVQVKSDEKTETTKIVIK
jgi:hypothetical protein